jgi:hypothetical protein
VKNFGIDVFFLKLWCELICYFTDFYMDVGLKALLSCMLAIVKAVPLYAMEALEGRGCITPTHSCPRH